MVNWRIVEWDCVCEKKVLDLITHSGVASLLQYFSGKPHQVWK